VPEAEGNAGTARASVRRCPRCPAPTMSGPWISLTICSPSQTKLSDAWADWVSYAGFELKANRGNAGRC
jgi:hypothetical protein